MSTIKNTATVSVAMLGAILSSTSYAGDDMLPYVYGRADVSVQSTDKGNADSIIEESSNASRLGVQNTHEIADNLNVFYRVEYEIYFDEAGEDSSGSDILFKARNSVVGLKGNYGSVFVGIHDTPLKQAQQKVDLFNDYYLGDIKSVFNGENRMSNTLSYVTPKLAGFEAWVMLLQGEGTDITGDGRADDSLGDAISAAVSYETGPFSAELAFDSEVKATDTLRASLQYKQGAFQLGAMFNQSEKSNGSADAESGFLLSGAVKLSDANTLKAQFTASDEKSAGGQMVSLGWDHALAKTTTLYAYYTDLSFDDATKDSSALGLGIQHKFGKDK